jgi:hypothetical protein
MINWINQRFGINLQENDLESIKEFSLVWNIFERFVCNNNFSISRAELAITNKNLDIAHFQNQANYFRNRYVTNGVTNVRFDNLHLRANDREAFVRRTLLDQTSTNHEIVLALIIIVYRFRNNLFHGIKDITVIDQQKENFDNANTFLKSLLGYF